MTEELWEPITGFRTYSVSNLGNVKNNQTKRLLSTSLNNYGQVKISLWSDETGQRHTKLVCTLVAEAFVYDRPDPRCNTPVILDNKLTNVRADNIVWRPRWFAWKYLHQFKTPIHRYYYTVPILNIQEDVMYESVVQCGKTEGLIFDDIWESTYKAIEVYPHLSVYQVVR